MQITWVMQATRLVNTWRQGRTYVPEAGFWPVSVLPTNGTQNKHRHLAAISRHACNCPFAHPMFGGEEPPANLRSFRRAVAASSGDPEWPSAQHLDVTDADAPEHHGLNTAKSLSFGFRLRAPCGKSCSR